MKFLLSIAAVAVALAGCVSQPVTPTEPGTGTGLSYVPKIAMEGVDKARYDNDVAACRQTATRITARSQADPDLIWAAIGLGLVTWYSQGLASGVAVGGFGSAAVDFAGQPSASLIAEHQQIAVVHCLAKRGYRNLDEGVRDTFYGDNNFNPSVVMMKPRRTGVDTYNVETLAKAGRCNLQPRAELTAKGPGYETYNVPCDNGATWAVRCEFGKCRVLAQALIRRS